MNLCRRRFLQSVLGAMAAGTLASNAALAIAPIPDLEPIAETVRLYRDLINTWEAAGSPPYYMVYADKHNPIIQTLTHKWDMLMSYVVQEFGDCPCTSADLQILYDHNHATALLTTDYLQSLVRGIIPVAVARNVLRKRMAITLNTPAFLNFASLYRDRILPPDINT